jgi:hypothetical protein
MGDRLRWEDTSFPKKQNTYDATAHRTSDDPAHMNFTMFIKGNGYKLKPNPYNSLFVDVSGYFKNKNGLVKRFTNKTILLEIAKNHLTFLSKSLVD